MLFGICPHTSRMPKFRPTYAIMYSDFIVIVEPCMSWFTIVLTIHLPVEELLPQTGIEPTPFSSPASKLARLQVHAITPKILDRFLNIDFQSQGFTCLSSAYYVSLCCILIM